MADPVADLKAKMPELFTSFVAKVGGRVTVTVRDLVAHGEIVSLAKMETEKAQVRLDGTSQEIWVPLTVLAHENCEG